MPANELRLLLLRSHIELIYMKMGDYFKLLLPSEDPDWKERINKEWMSIYKHLKYVRSMIQVLQDIKNDEESELIKEGEDDEDSDDEIELLASHINNIYVQMGDYLKMLEPSKDPDWKERIKEWPSIYEALMAVRTMIKVLQDSNEDEWRVSIKEYREWKDKRAKDDEDSDDGSYAKKIPRIIF